MISNNFNFLIQNKGGIIFISLLTFTFIFYIAFIAVKIKKSKSSSYVYLIPTFIIAMFFLLIVSLNFFDGDTLQKFGIFVIPISIALLLSTLIFMGATITNNNLNITENFSDNTIKTEFIGPQCYNTKRKLFGHINLKTNECVPGTQSDEEIEEIKKKKIEKLEKKCKIEKTKKCKKEIRELKKSLVSNQGFIGPCIYYENNNKKFGVKIPEIFGNKCVSNERYKRFINNKKIKKNKLFKIEPENKNIYIKENNSLIKVIPSNMTKCSLNKEKMYYDKLCKENINSKWGVEKFTNIGCGTNGIRAICKEGFNLGYKYEDNSTKCYPVETDMNNICNREMRKKPNVKNVNFGYEEVTNNGCPKNFIRGICSGDYYNGEQILKNSTECFNQNLNPDRKCKEKYGQLSFSKNIKTTNCLPGYIRAICSKN